MLGVASAATAKVLASGSALGGRGPGRRTARCWISDSGRAIGTAARVCRGRSRWVTGASECAVRRGNGAGRALVTGAAATTGAGTTRGRRISGDGWRTTWDRVPSSLEGNGTAGAIVGAGRRRVSATTSGEVRGRGRESRVLGSSTEDGRLGRASSGLTRGGGGTTTATRVRGAGFGVGISMAGSGGFTAAGTSATWGAGLGGSTSTTGSGKGWGTGSKRSSAVLSSTTSMSE